MGALIRKATKTVEVTESVAAGAASADELASGAAVVSVETTTTTTTTTTTASAEAVVDGETMPTRISKKRGHVAGAGAAATSKKSRRDFLPPAPPASNKVGTVYLGRIPHGFYEEQMRDYFKQFGEITQLRLSRNKKTGASKHFAFIQFAEAQVAKIVAETMNNYLMFGHLLKCQLIPEDKVHPETWKGANRKFVVMGPKPAALVNQSCIVPAAAYASTVAALVEKETKQNEKMKTLGIDYQYTGLAEQAQALGTAVPVAAMPAAKPEQQTATATTDAADVIAVPADENEDAASSDEEDIMAKMAEIVSDADEASADDVSVDEASDAEDAADAASSGDEEAAAPAPKRRTSRSAAAATAKTASPSAKKAAAPVKKVAATKTTKADAKAPAKTTAKKVPAAKKAAAPVKAAKATKAAAAVPKAEPKTRKPRAAKAAAK